MRGDEDEVDEKISPSFVMLLLSIFQQEIYDMQLDHKRGMGAETRNKERDEEAKNRKRAKRKNEKTAVREECAIHVPVHALLPNLCMIFL